MKCRSLYLCSYANINVIRYRVNILHILNVQDMLYSVKEKHNECKYRSRESRNTWNRADIYGGIFLPSLVRYNYVDLSDLYVDLSDIMSTCQIILLLCLWHELGKNTFFKDLIFNKMDNWQVNIKIRQVNIKIWQDDIEIWQVNIII